MSRGGKWCIVDEWGEVLKNVWMRTYITGVHAFIVGSTDLGGSDDTAIHISTLCVCDDCKVGIHEVETNGPAVWEM